jgi:MoxR-like ATPase
MEIGIDKPNDRLLVPSSLEEHLGALRSTAQGIKQRFMEEVDKAIIGEEEAKEMLLVLAISGAENAMSGILYGPPSTGKSELIKTLPKMFGLDRNQVARVPHNLDLSPAQLVGKEEAVSKNRWERGVKLAEKIVVKHRAYINENTKMLFFDEVNRTSPAALNAALGILQDGSIEVYDDDNNLKEVNGFDLILFAMNNYGTLFTSDLDPALISRLSMGVVMGKKASGELSSAAQSIWGDINRTDQENEIRPLNVSEGINEIRESIDIIPMSATIIELGKKATRACTESLEEIGYNNGDTRTAAQIKRVSRILSLINNHTEVNEQDIKWATYYNLVAKLGALGIGEGGDPSSTARDIIAKI